MLTVKNLSVQFGSLKIIDDVSFEVNPGQWMMVVGPNGAGKSTIINAISQGIPYCGDAFFGQKDIAAIKPVMLARKIGILTQNHYVGYSFTVEEVVKLGRYAWSSGVFSSSTDEDERKIDQALEMTGMKSFRNQSVLTLSGGELQRTFLAQLFAQDPQLLILDEPTNHLDLVYQKQMFELIRNWITETGRAVMSVVHDLSLARAYGTDAILMDKGRIAASGRIDQVLTRDLLAGVYALDVVGWMNQLLSHWQEV